MTDQPAVATALLQYLPAIYQDDNTLGQFLLAFEEVLLGGADNYQDKGLEQQKDLQRLVGLEKMIADIPKLFDPYADQEEFFPYAAQKEFLPWLASWVAFSLWADIGLETQRTFIANMTELYRWRGTKEGLTQLFWIFTKVTRNK